MVLDIYIYVFTGECGADSNTRPESAATRSLIRGE